MTEPRRRVLSVLVNRANYGRLKPVLQAIQSEPSLELQVLCGGTMVLKRFDRTVELVREDGFPVVGEVFLELEGSTPTTMAKSVGFATIEFTSEFARIRPDVVLIIGDRYEALAATVAAAYMNLPICHVQGGEVSGSIDESARHAITKFAQFHVPATERAADYLVRMGERRETILTVGCPSSDIARTLERELDPALLNSRGSGAAIDPGQPFLLAIFHPTTTEYGSDREHMRSLLQALHTVSVPTLLLWPNIDAGADEISKEIRVFRTQNEAGWLRTQTNLSPEDFHVVLANAACAVGNSSSFVRDASFFGTPVVLVGRRQAGREAAENVTRVSEQTEEIASAVREQLDHGRYPVSTLYGDGHVSERVAKALATAELYLQKRLAYADAEPDGTGARA